ncbi:TetR/AcrR family transcriptional regulator [Nocardioides sp. CFH 31398]|uniref:TetR/AcrR family transcriptional regulator n=1 Tax=Nocardioides sp. CFH 31398 TaxID=2919579 RepID=UPI001F0522FC|nr:TetR/AcrR family transcriptional regulator C-terminal domain-containing protein [Nocardioides sp. CFH 31398]MCH1867051.1 TetR/AcrR family transcriptional regulator C-terminal domain-containing protein [Nocardioides sp. CFH 31398]
MPPRRRASHSLESVLGEAVALLDEAGEQALTFRALAARLGGGVASIYWYVANREELLDRATDVVMAEVLERVEAIDAGQDPVAVLRAMSLTLFDEMVRRPWFATYMLRNTGLQPHAMRMFDLIGQQVMRLGLTPREEFHAVSSLLSYVVGVAVDMAQPPPQEFLDSDMEPAEFLAMYADRWRALDPATHPFAHRIADVFAVHDDAEVFRAGLDMFLAGLRERAVAGQEL